MSDSGAAGAGPRQFGEGPLGRASALIYNLLVVELFFLLTAVPGLLPLLLLERHPSNLPLFAAGALPVGPALSAAVYALHRRSRDMTDLQPATAFWRGYRLNALPVLRLWLPWLAFLTIIGINLGYFGAADVPGWWAALLVAVALAATLWMANALVITSLFTFRTIDVAKLAQYFLGRTPSVTVGNGCVLIVAVGITVVTFEVVVLLLAALLVLAMLRIAQPMITQVREDFVA